MLEFTPVQWIVVIICSVMIGFSKTGIPGAGILLVPMLAAVMPAKESVGFLLPILCLADVLAILYWRKHVEWHQLVRLLPWAIVGIVAGFFALNRINNQQLMPLIGGLILALIAVTMWRNRKQVDHKIPSTWWFAGLMGILAGATSMLANAAGPVMTIYLLAMRLKKNAFVGTTAWFFWTINLIKIPFSSKLDLINQHSLLTDLAMLPAILAGGVLGIFLVHRIPQKLFDAVVSVLAVLAAVYLCIKAF